MKLFTRAGLPDHTQFYPREAPHGQLLDYFILMTVTGMWNFRWTR